ncbi:MAG: hypothetical protein ACKVOQ_19585 [Cyclobacteriaceae bacterium]
MKSTYKIVALTAIIAASFLSCDENDGITVANTAAVPTPTANSANFFMINATVDGPALDFYVNGVSLGSSILGSGLASGYKNVAITTPGLNAIANTSIRSKAASGSTIGGLLGSSDLIFRATNTGIGNLVAAPNTRYTFIALDELDRPVPLRTFSLNSVTKALAADITYYNRITKGQISNDAYKALSVADQANFVSIGTVPAGVSDPGGLRYYAITDTYPTDAAIAAAITTNQSFIRFVHASPNAPGVFVRLVGPTTINLVTSAALNVMSVAGGFTPPTVGSRTASLAWPAAVATGAATTSYTVEVHTNATFTALALSVPSVSFAPGKVYTIVARGLVGGTGSSALGVAIGQHN